MTIRMSDSVGARTRDIGLRLRKARRGQGLSLEDLAVRTDRALSRSRISNYEQGLRRLGLEEAMQLAQALGTLSAAEILGLDDEDFLAGEERNLLGLFRGADARGKEEILHVARSVADLDGGDRRTEDLGRVARRSLGDDKRGGLPLPSVDDSASGGPVRRRGHRSAEESERQVQARSPHLSLDYATFERWSLPATWRCARHGVDFTTSGSALLAPTAVGCPMCREDHRRELRQKRYADRDLEYHLTALTAAGNERDVAVYRLRAAGKMVVEIANELNISESNVGLRMMRIRRVLARADEEGGEPRVQRGAP